LRFCVLFPRSQNVHLIKDVGMIAYKLFDLYKVDATLATYNNDDYIYLKDEVKGLKISYIQRVFNKEILDCILFIMRNSKKIDVLQLFHITLSSVLYTSVYKLFNRKGKIFLKLDCTEEIIDRINGLGKLSKGFLNFFLNRIDVVGVEQKNILNSLKQLLGKNSRKLEYVPNGIDFRRKPESNNINVQQKKNIVLNVGRIGNFEKATEVLLEAFANINGVSENGWKLVLVGPIEEGFGEYIDEFFDKHPDLKGCIEFKGAIYNRNELYKEYAVAKIFCLSSIYESFGISLIEAAAFGDVIISTDVGIASELVNKGQGAVVKVGDTLALKEALEEYMKKEDITSISKEMIKLCYENYNWDRIIQRLYKRL
jgi:glycosyltransferase involved in cell wall biosynthesis